MVLRYPAYYKNFSCIADKCEDTCCAGWEVDIDDVSYEYYMGIEGEWGERLRQNMKEYGGEDEDVYERHGFILRPGKRCPFLNEGGLCDLYRALGESALCDVCRNTPRNFLEYGTAREISISAACAEAGRLIYGGEEPISFVEEETGEELGWEETEEEAELACQVRLARDGAIRILQNRKLPLEQRILSYLSYAEAVQGCLNENQPWEIEHISLEPYLGACICILEPEDDAGRDALAGQQYEMFLRRMATYTRLDSVSGEWEEMLRQLQELFVAGDEGFGRYHKVHGDLAKWLAEQRREYEYEHLMVYYVFMCQARCVDDYDFIGRAKLAAVSFLMVRDMDAARFAARGRYEKEDRIEIARIYAREVEHSEENLEQLAEEFIFEDIYGTGMLRRVFLHP